MNKSINISLFAALVFAAVAAGLFASRPVDHAPRVAELESKLQQATQEITRLKSELAKPKTIASTRPEPSVTSAGSPAKPNGPGEPSALAKMVSDPRMREAMLGRSRWVALGTILGMTGALRKNDGAGAVEKLARLREACGASVWLKLGAAVGSKDAGECLRGVGG